MYATVDVLKAISLDSTVSDDPATVANGLLLLYPSEHLWLAIEELVNDDTWSEDQEPYRWLNQVWAFTDAGDGA